MFSPHHVQALLHERQRDLLDSAATARRARRRPATATAAAPASTDADADGLPARRGIRLPARAVAWFTGLSRSRRAASPSGPSGVVGPEADAADAGKEAGRRRVVAAA